MWVVEGEHETYELIFVFNINYVLGWCVMFIGLLDCAFFKFMYMLIKKKRGKKYKIIILKKLQLNQTLTNGSWITY